MKNLIIALLLIGSFQSIAQGTEGVESIKKSIFPDKCLGVWQGTMYIFGSGKLRDSVEVKFTAAKTDIPGTYIWKTEYLSAKRPIVKDYKLIVDELEEGRFILDEGNGVKLAVHNINDKMYSLFKVDEINLTSSTELLNNQLVFEVTSGKELDEIQGVTNFSITNVQRVVLNKIE